MVSDITKIQIAVGLLIGVIILTFFTFIRTITETFILKEIEKLSPESQRGAGCFFLIMFLAILILVGIILIIILVNQTDLHPIFDIFRFQN